MTGKIPSNPTSTITICSKKQKKYRRAQDRTKSCSVDALNPRQKKAFFSNSEAFERRVLLDSHTYFFDFGAINIVFIYKHEKPQ